MKTYNLNNLKITINNIEFKLNEIDIDISNNIKLIANTSNQNYIQISNLVESALFKTKSYKSIIKLHNIDLYGVYPIDFYFNYSNISVVFSVDTIFGDLEILKLKLSRKEKIIKINKIRNNLIV